MPHTDIDLLWLVLLLVSKWVVWPSGVCASLWPASHLLCPLSVLHLLANLVAEDLVPVDLGACDGQLATQGLEGGVRHCLVVLTDGSLVIIFSILNDVNKFLGCLTFISHWY